jgi:hypothetical protein
VVDNEHSPSDVTCGALIGAGYAVLCFWRYFGGALLLQHSSAQVISVADVRKDPPEALNVSGDETVDGPHRSDLLTRVAP